jgi:hypothetical protein
MSGGNGYVIGGATVIGGRAGAGAVFGGKGGRGGAGRFTV